MSNGVLLSIHNLVHRYEAVTALNNLSFELETGEIFGLLGPNGGGKSTLFQILSTRLLPSSGDVYYQDINLFGQPDTVRQKMAVVFQHPGLDEKLTVRENLKYHGMLYGIPGNVLKQRIQDLLSRFDLSSRMNSLVSELSGGMRRKVEIVKGLLAEPELILMDEPGTGLDPGARENFWEIIREVNNEKRTTFLITTHLMEEAENCDRIGILDSGNLVAIGKPGELKQELGAEMVEIKSGEIEKLTSRLAEDYSISGEIVNGAFYFRHESGHRLIPKIVESYPGLVEEVAVRTPSLNDVFRHHTGKSFTSAHKNSQSE